MGAKCGSDPQEIFLSLPNDQGWHGALHIQKDVCPSHLTSSPTQFTQEMPSGRGWSEGVNRVNGENAVYFYNHATGQLKYSGPKHAPLTCNEDTNASGEVRPNTLSETCSYVSRSRTSLFGSPKG